MAVHDRHGPEARRALEAEALIPLDGWRREIARGLELIAAQEGLGYRIVRGQRFLQSDTTFAVLIVIGVIGVTMDLLFRVVRNRLAPWAR